MTAPVLAFDWFAPVHVARRYPSELGGAEGDLRDPFERDRARIIHSGAFRRLQGKSQIFAAGWSGYLRTRVTHAMEVAQIARAIASNHGLPGSLAEAAALAHDLGHPPFGHNGEDALNACMSPYGGFEGNAQTYRILTRLEPLTTRHPGVNVTRATLQGILKYPGGKDGHPALYVDDAQDDGGWLYDQGMPTGQPLAPVGGSVPPRSIICQVMDWADDIAYSLHDLEDGLSARLLNHRSLVSGEVIERVTTRVRHSAAHLPGAADLDTAAVREILQGLYARLDDGYSLTPGTARVREVMGGYVRRFVTATRIQPAAAHSQDSAFAFTLLAPTAAQLECAVLKAITQELILRDQRTGVYARQAVRIISDLFGVLLDAASHDLDDVQAAILPSETRAALRDTSTEAARARLICDFVSGMTDAQASQYHERLFSARQSSPFAPL
ncbi:dNTP triphosphohydrolase [Deinococcus sp. KNUC1210]|uniref:deoxyguanosinetriphosphate triphosphohydrolase family protein n=1 Tax=Deinococcus sp. KNUC1210 TaxID=2917691 RepID=UPI001EEF8AB2|nr:dNTP triphosphohydrolase [Deinococcus sp. KNUC1210]ULH16746.1 dNTP triphosphohydrolase [Deinococcus sp. KNUC1210]